MVIANCWYNLPVIPRKKYGRYKDGRKHTGNTYHWPGHLTHCQQGGFAWRHAIFYMMLDGFDHDNGIIDHQAYGQY